MLHCKKQDKMPSILTGNGILDYNDYVYVVGLMCCIFSRKKNTQCNFP